MPSYGVVVSATGCGEDIDDDGNPITINAVAVYGISAVDTACPPACLPAFLPPSPPPAHAFAAGDPHNSTRVAAFREASGLKTLKCLKSDEQLKWSGEAWTAVTDTDAETIAAELTSNLAKYKGCAVRVAA